MARDFTEEICASHEGFHRTVARALFIPSIAHQLGSYFEPTSPRTMRTSSIQIRIATAKTITTAEPASTRAAMRSIIRRALWFRLLHVQDHAIADRAALVPAEEFDVTDQPEADRDNAS